MRYTPPARIHLVRCLPLLVLLSLQQLQRVDSRQPDARTQPSDFEFLIAGGYRPPKHTLTKHLVSIRTAKPTAYFGDNHFCAGAIISSRIVLTAAHCVMDPNKVITRPRRLTVVAGAPNRMRMDSSTIQVTVESVIPHSKFERKGGHDIAILRLTQPFPDDNDAIKIIPLTSRPAPVDTVCVVLGWGQLFLNGPYSAEAVYVNLTVMEFSDCKQIYKRRLDASMMCASDKEDSEKDVCRGDSGAPLICDGKLAGITAWGVRCGENGFPTVFTSIFQHREWIRHVNDVNKLQPSASACRSVLLVHLLAAAYFASV